MQESLLVIIEVIVGTIFTCDSCALGAYLVKRTYMEVTNPLSLLVKMDKDDDTMPEPKDMTGMNTMPPCWNSVVRRS